MKIRVCTRGQHNNTADWRSASHNKISYSQSSRRGWLVLLVLVSISWGELFASDPLPVIRVEEDWVVEIGTPDPLIDAPQIVTTISPFSSLDGAYAVFELNHMTLPDYTAGGMQLQVWSGESILNYKNFPTINALTHVNESVHYTMKMEISGGNMSFEVVNGTSSTWGDFGGQGYLKSTYNTTLTDLGTYSPITSVTNSRVGFASHQVKRYSLIQVRYYSQDGLQTVDSTERVVSTSNGDPANN